MTKPNYQELFNQIQVTTDPVLKEQLLQQAYSFPVPLEPEEASLFSYSVEAYVSPNPGDDESGEYVSYVGVYINQDGEYSGEYP